MILARFSVIFPLFSVVTIGLHTCLLVLLIYCCSAPQELETLIVCIHMPLCVLEITYSVTVLKQGLFLEYVGSTVFNSRLPAYKADTFAAEPTLGPSSVFYISKT